MVVCVHVCVHAHAYMHVHVYTNMCVHVCSCMCVNAKWCHLFDSFSDFLVSLAFLNSPASGSSVSVRLRWTPR